MTKMVSIKDFSEETTTSSFFTQRQIDIIKSTICKGCSDDEMEVFLMACQITGLNPFMKQIHAVKRAMRQPDGSYKEVMSIQTGIDGYRLIAERTGRYAPSKEATYTYDDKGRMESATAYIKKMTADGTWHEVSASAYWAEYVQRKKDGTPTGFWASMPRVMLAKCAEALALRKAFPAEMSGIYTREEMAQADSADITISPTVEAPPPKKAEPVVKEQPLFISKEQAQELAQLLEMCSDSYRAWAVDVMQKEYGVQTLEALPASLYERVRSAAMKNATGG